MKLRIFAACAAMLSLSGCLSFGDFETNLAAFQGRPVQDAFDVLGYPAGKQEFGQDTVYTWARDHRGAMILPQTTNTTGYVGGTQFGATSTTSQVVPMHYACTVKLIAGPDGVVRKWQYEGNAGGCEPYMRSLRKAAKP